MGTTILVVDDSDFMRHIVGIFLKNAGYDVIEACDGKDALSKLIGQKIHLIISDVNMPIMDGITFVAEARKQTDYKDTPIIMMTTESSKNKKFEALMSSANAWIDKPFPPANMLAAVARCIMS